MAAIMDALPITCLCRVGVVERPPRDVFLRHSCASKKVYETTYQLLARALQVQPRVTLPDLALAFDATHIIEVRQQANVRAKINIKKRNLMSWLSYSGLKQLMLRVLCQAP